MRKTLGVLLFLIPAIGLSQVKEFGWLAGTWKVPGKESFEVWKIGKDKKTMEGIAFRMKGADSVVTERTQIKYEGNSFHYIPDVAGEQPEVYFKITRFNEKGFTAENPKHDFPKIIRYERQANGSLKAEIEGDGKVIPFYFDKIK